MATVTVSEKGWIVIPKEIRQRYDLKKGDKVHVIDFGGRIAVIPASADPISESFGMLGAEPSLTKGLLEEKRRELEEEEREVLPPLERGR